MTLPSPPDDPIRNPPSADSLGLGSTVALLAHVGLIAALAWGVAWKRQEIATVSAELWSAVPRSAAPAPAPAPRTEVTDDKEIIAPPKPAAPPPPPVPAPTPAPVPAPRLKAAPPPPPTAAEQREADIARERAEQRRREAEQAAKNAQKARQEQERREREREQAEKDKAARLKAERLEREKAEQKQKKAEQDRLEKERAEKDKAEKEKAAKAREKAERDKAAKDAAAKEAAAKADKERAARLREDNLRRMQKQLGEGEADGEARPSGGGQAAQSSGPSAGYAGRLRAYLKPKLTFTGEIRSSAPAVVRVRVAPDGTIISRELLKSSGQPEWDQAVISAIDKAGIVPRDIDNRVPPVIDIPWTATER